MKFSSKAALIVAAGALCILFLFGAGLVGYSLGRIATPVQVASGAASQNNEDVQPVTREVTREVVVVLTPTPEVVVPTVELVQPLDNPEAGATPATSDVGANTGGANAVLDEAALETYFEVWSLIEAEFDGELPEDRDRLYAAIAGSLETLDDDYTRFIRPEIAERMREDLNGSVSGIGAFVRENEEGFIEITRPIDGQPADLAGLRPGDVIIAIDGQEVEGLGFDEVLLMVRGPEGSTVYLTIARQGEDEPLEFTIVRTLFEVPVVASEMMGTEEFPIGYIQLSSFTRNAETAVNEELRRLLEQNPQALIFDLRDNGGGFLDQAVGVADIFLDDGVVLYERSSGGLDKTFESHTGDSGETIPLVVLVNEGSASASEIVAGAVQDRERGVLIGESTFGKGSVQLVHNLSDGSELRVTIARWYTPDNNSISEEGIAPDIEVPTPSDLGDEDDTQLQRAIEFLQQDSLEGA